MVVLVGISTFVGFSGHAFGAPQTTSDAEATLTTDINQERVSRGFGALTVAPDLIVWAERHSADMAAAGRPYHDPNIQTQVQNWQELGDNVGSGPDADHLHQGFMNSQIHRDEILHPSYTEVGVGAYWAGNVLYVTEVFRLPQQAAPAPVRHATPPPARVVTHTVAVPVPAPPKATPVAPPTTVSAPRSTVAPSTSTSLVAAAGPQWPTSVLKTQPAASHGAKGTDTSAIAVVAAALLMLVAAVETAALRHRAARS